MNTAMNPQFRLRRLRQAHWLREMIEESQLTPANLILPLFVKEQGNVESVGSLKVHPLGELVAVAQQAAEQNLNAIALFPQIPLELKDKIGSEATRANNLVCRSIKLIKKRVPSLAVIADVALDPYTSHGQDGILDKHQNIDNDATLKRLTQQALTLADAGADAIAPSDMMDGRIGAIRTALDNKNKPYLPIIAYTAKYASCLYEPFRMAIGSAKLLKGDKKSYQLNPANTKEALRQARADITQGADMLMVKPAQFYLDIIKTFSQAFDQPVVGYQVSGEYEMLRYYLKYANFENILMESLLSIRRAGASAIFSYGALEAAQILNRTNVR